MRVGVTPSTALASTIAAIAAGAMAPAQASAGTRVFAGTVDPYYESVGIGFDGSGPGTYRIDYLFTVPATGAVNAVVTETYNFFDETGQNVGGDDVDQINTATFVDSTRGSLQFTVAPGYEYVDALGWRTTGFFYFNNAYVEFFAADPGTTIGYRITATYLAHVPEPATWALMILGFGAVGAALRRAPRRHAVA